RTCTAYTTDASASSSTTTSDQRKTIFGIALPPLDSAQPHPGIDPGVRHVDHDVAGDVEHGAHEHHRAHDREVLAADGVDHIGAEPGDAEEALEDEAAQEHVRQVAARARDDRDERVGQHVAHQHAGLRQPLGARRAHVVAADLLE